MLKNILTSAMLLAAVPASAQDRPSILPDRDVAVEYLSRGMIAGPAGELANTVMVRFERDTGRLRIDGPYGRFYAIVNVDSGRMIIVMPEQRLFAEQAADRDIMAVFRQGLAFTRVGDEMIAGRHCTVYDTSVNDHSGRVCLTEDGVLLRAVVADPDRRPELKAVRVTYARQPEGMFQIPAGFRRLDVPNLPFGFNSGPRRGG
jgi:hypothetical protein